MKDYQIKVKFKPFSKYGTSSVKFKGADSLEEARAKLEELKRKYPDHVSEYGIWKRVE